MTSAELREAERLVDLLKPDLELRRTRRSELHHHGRTLAPRAMLRRNLATGGDLVEWVWQRRVKHPRPLVVLCDISGSMERHSRLLLRFVQALSGSAVHAEAFVFGTHLTRVTRLLRDRDRDRGLAKVSDAVSDWSGGTRIGESLREFNQRWARRVLRSGGRRGRRQRRLGPRRPALVAQEMARLQRQLPSPDLAQPARRRARLPAARGRHAGGVSVHRRLPARGHRGQPGAARRDPRGNSSVVPGPRAADGPIAGPEAAGSRPPRKWLVPTAGQRARARLKDELPPRLANRQGAWAGPNARRTTGFSEPTRPTPLAPDPQPSAPRRLSGRTT